MRNALCNALVVLGQMGWPSLDRVLSRTPRLAYVLIVRVLITRNLLYLMHVCRDPAPPCRCLLGGSTSSFLVFWARVRVFREYCSTSRSGGQASQASLPLSLPVYG